ncbi:MAG: hypothetical protein RLY93_05870 [Sumerlaeia bacterium]
MRSSGTYIYRFAGIEVGREIWSIRPEGDTWRYQADVMRNHVRTELHLNTFTDSARPRNAGIKRTTPDGPTASADFHFHENTLHTVYTDRNFLRREAAPREWPTEGIFHPFATCLMTHVLRYAQLNQSEDSDFDCLFISYSGLNLNGKIGKGRIRRLKSRDFGSVTGLITAQIWEAKFSFRLPMSLQLLPHRLVFDARGICHHVSAGPWRVELVELEVADAQTPLPVRSSRADPPSSYSVGSPSE